LYGSYLVIHGNITVGVIFAFLSYADMFRSPIHELGSILSNFSSSIACLNRVFELLDYDNIFDGNEILTNIDLITFDKVYFKYDKDYVLKNVSFNISGGEHIAIVGQTGSGKTTIINLLMGIYNTTKGNIYINNKTIDEYKKTSIYENISVILQKPFLFEGTILENVLYGNKNKTKKDAIKALKIVGADFVFKLANKENEYIGVNGKKLSVGERQLIVIARTMLKDAKALIIDEATSNVDLLTEKKVYEAMEKLMKDKTVIMIAHRLRTIENADKIIYLENGIIKETGTHKDLLAKKSKYYSLYKSQFL
jgi:ATP-binding cassette subfamily B protein